MTVLRMIQPIVMMKSDSVGLIELDTVIREETNANSCILKKPVSFIHKMDTATRCDAKKGILEDVIMIRQALV